MTQLSRAALVAVLVAGSPVWAQDGGEKKADTPAPVSARKVPELIKAALALGPAPAIAVLEKYGGLPHRPIVAAVARALKHKDDDVKTAAIKALRYNTEKSAFSVLYHHRGDKTIVGRHEITVQYYLALGQHANSKALPFLLHDLMSKGRRDPALGARFYAIGRMREKASIEALLRFLRANKRSRKEIYVALTALTGHDAGNKAGKWFEWWRDNRKGYRVPKEQPEMSERMAQTWEEVWRRPGEEDPGSKKKKKRRKQKRDKKKPTDKDTGNGKQD